MNQTETKYEMYLSLINKKLLSAKIKFKSIKFTSNHKYLLLHRNAYDYIRSEKQAKILYKLLADKKIDKFENYFNENIYHLLKTKTSIWAIPTKFTEKSYLNEPFKFLDKKCNNMFRPIKSFRSVKPNDYIGYRGYIIDYVKLF